MLVNRGLWPQVECWREGEGITDRVFCWQGRGVEVPTAHSRERHSLL